MSLGLRRSLNTILPRLKYDTRIGYFLTEDRVQDTDGKWFPEQKNIPRETFRAVFDMENVVIGFMDFPKGAPPDIVVLPRGGSWGDPPTTRHKLGVRLLMLLGDDLGGGIRELMSTSIGFLNGLDRLHDLFEVEQLKHGDMLPVVTLVDATKVEMPNGTSFEPVFGIESWVERPDELPPDGMPLSKVDKKSTNKHDGMDDAIPF
jgi:hypothetical protein